MAKAVTVIEDPEKAIHKISGEEIMDYINGIDQARSVLEMSTAYIEDSTDQGREMWMLRSVLILAHDKLQSVIDALLAVQNKEEV